MRPVLEPQETILQWAASQLRCQFHPPCFAVGVVSSSGTLVGAAIFNDYADRNIELTMVGRGVWSRSVRSLMAHIAFEGCQAQRVTVRTRKKNKTLRALISKAGWKMEGTLRRWYTDDDAVIYSMLKDECPWLQR